MVPSNVYTNVVMLICLIFVPTNVCSYAIDQTASTDTATLQVLNEFRARLVAEAVIHDPKELTMDTFDELEVLRLLPMVIRFMKANALSSLEQDAFEHIYGSIWELVIEESHRHRGQSRNAILTALLASPEIRQPKSDSNDAHHNSIAKVAIPETTKSISREAPSQRVLHTAAMIVQKYYQRQTKQAITNKRKATRARQTQRLRSANVHAKQLSGDSIRVTIELPRYKRSIAKAKQSSVKHEEVEEEEEEDPEMEAKILAAIQAQIGNPSLEEEDDEEEDDDEAAAELGEDSSEYLDDEPDYMGILGDDDDDDDDDDDSEDEEDDDGHFSNGLLRASVQEFENPSFNELLLLAARHRAVQQRRQKQLHDLGHRKPSSTFQSSYEDY